MALIISGVVGHQQRVNLPADLGDKIRRTKAKGTSQIVALPKNVYSKRKLKNTSLAERRQERLRAEKEVIQDFLEQRGYALYDKLLGEGSYAKVKLGKVLDPRLKCNPRVADMVDKVGHKLVSCNKTYFCDLMHCSKC